MNAQTIRKAYNFVKYGDVKVCEDSNPPKSYHFQVLNARNDWVDVWLLHDQAGNPNWSCNAKAEQFGCVMHTGPKNEPYCSHTLACRMQLAKMRREVIKWQKE